ncbi:hypothetical protein D3C72_1445210 [compost metagenome]
MRARGQRRAPARAVGFQHDDIGAAQRAQQGHAHQAQAAGADHHHRLLGQHLGRDLADGAIGGQARTRVGRGLLRPQIADADQVARVRHHDVVAVAARLEDSEKARRGAEILAPPTADLAFPAAYPWIDQKALSRQQVGRRIGTRRDDLAHGLVAQRQRQRHPTLLHAQALIAAQVV